MKAQINKFMNECYICIVGKCARKHFHLELSTPMFPKKSKEVSYVDIFVSRNTKF